MFVVCFSMERWKCVGFDGGMSFLLHKGIVFMGM